MGLIRAAAGSVGGVLADQWLEFFHCDSLEADVLVAKGQKKDGKRNVNVKGSDNVISNGSKLVVNKGQAAIIVDNGKIAEFCAEEGSYTYDQGSEPSIFTGGLGERLGGPIKNMWERFKFGGVPSKDQRIYYFNTKEIMGNKYGTPSPIPYLIYDPNINLKLTISLRANGEYSYRIVNPILFYANVCGNVDPNYTRDKIDSQLKSEIVTALGPALAKLGGLEYHEISFNTERLAEIFNEVLSAKWKDLRGIEIASFGITCTASPEDEKKIKQLQANAVMRDPTMAAAHLAASQGDAMVAAANNQGGMGAMGAFMGMGMAGNAGGMNAQTLFGMGQQQGAPAPVAGMPGTQQAQAAPAAGASGGWACACGHAGNSGKFCAECGKPMPPPATSWTCACGQANTGKFCAECGAPAPAGPWTCACGHAGNTGKFCAECGKPKA